MTTGFALQTLRAISADMMTTATTTVSCPLRTSSILVQLTMAIRLLWQISWKELIQMELQRTQNGTLDLPKSSVLTQLPPTANVPQMIVSLSQT